MMICFEILRESDISKIVKVRLDELKEKYSNLESARITIIRDGKEFEIAGDTVITSMGYHPKPALEGAKLIGDCKKVGNLRTVVWGAWKVAMKI